MQAVKQRFNLAIEMLVISGEYEKGMKDLLSVSISQSRCLSFQVSRLSLPHHPRRNVSISQSRCLSFQVRKEEPFLSYLPLRFNLAIEMLVISGRRRLGRHGLPTRCFNLAIEMLVISGGMKDLLAGIIEKFQSRNRDACHFRAVTNCIQQLQISFNLAIEMLVISGSAPRSASNIEV